MSLEIEYLKWVIIVLLGGVTWFMKRTLDAHEKDVENLKGELSHIKQNYLHKDDFKDFKIELRSMFEELRKDIRSLQHNV